MPVRVGRPGWVRGNYYAIQRKPVGRGVGRPPEGFDNRTGTMKERIKEWIAAHAGGSSAARRLRL